jgi:hypothetical protein
MGTIATDHTKVLRASGHSLLAALTGGYNLAYLVAAGCVAVAILVAFLVLRPPARPQLVVDEDPEIEAAEVAAVAQAA